MDTLPDATSTKHGRETRPACYLAIACSVLLVMYIMGWLGSGGFEVCGQPYLHPWYFEYLAVEQVPLPPEITVTAESSGFQYGNVLVVRNSASADLYIWGMPWGDSYQVEDIGVSVPWEGAPVAKIVSDTAYYWTRQYDDEDNVTGWQWQMDSELRDGGAVIRVSSGRLSVLGGKRCYLQRPEQRRREPPFDPAVYNLVQ